MNMNAVFEGMAMGIGAVIGIFLLMLALYTASLVLERAVAATKARQFRKEEEAKARRAAAGLKEQLYPNALRSKEDYRALKARFQEICFRASLLSQPGWERDWLPDTNDGFPIFSSINNRLGLAIRVDLADPLGAQVAQGLSVAHVFVAPGVVEVLAVRIVPTNDNLKVLEEELKTRITSHIERKRSP
jgi:hypothetical protein